MMQIGIVQCGGEIGGGAKQLVERDARFDEFIRWLVTGQILQDDEAAPVGQAAMEAAGILAAASLAAASASWRARVAVPVAGK